MNFKWSELTKDLSFRAKLAADIAIEDIKKNCHSRDSYTTIADIRYQVYDFLGQISNECRDYIVKGIKEDFDVYRILGDVIQEYYPDILIDLIDSSSIKPYYEDKETITFLKEDIRKNINDKDVIMIDKNYSDVDKGTKDER